MNWKENMLMFVPPAVLLVSGFIPVYGLLSPIITFFILYIITIAMAKYRCNTTAIKEVSTKSVAVVSYYIALTILAIVAMILPIGIVSGVDMLFNNIFMWFAIGYLYKITFNKLFSC